MRSWLAVLLLCGCVSPTDDVQRVRSFDYDSFVTDVQPILADLCGNPTCHGRIERPLSIYSALSWRADPEHTFLREELDEEELQHNFTVSSVLASETDAPEESLLLRKTLGEVAGTYHGGGVIIETTTHPDYRTMLRWVQTGWPP